MDSFCYEHNKKKKKVWHTVCNQETYNFHYISIEMTIRNIATVLAAVDRLMEMISVISLLYLVTRYRLRRGYWLQG